MNEFNEPLTPNSTHSIFLRGVNLARHEVNILPACVSSEEG